MQLDLQMNELKLSNFRNSLDISSRSKFDLLGMGQKEVVYNLGVNRALIYLNQLNFAQREQIEAYHSLAATMQRRQVVDDAGLTFVALSGNYFGPIGSLAFGAGTELFGAPNTYRDMSLYARDRYFAKVVSGMDSERAHKEASFEAFKNELSWGLIQHGASTALSGLQYLKRSDIGLDEVAYRIDQAISGRSGIIDTIYGRAKQAERLTSYSSLSDLPGITAGIGIQVYNSELKDSYYNLVVTQKYSQNNKVVIAGIEHSPNNSTSPGNAIDKAADISRKNKDNLKSGAVISVKDNLINQYSNFIFNNSSFNNLKLKIAPELGGELNGNSFNDYTANDGSIFSLANPLGLQNTFNGNQVTNESLFNMLSRRIDGVTTFFVDYTREALNLFEDPQRAAAFQTALAQIAVRLANGEDFNVVITQIGAELYLSKGVADLFNNLAIGSTLIPAQYQQYANTALANAVLQGLMSGDFPEALQNASVQAVVQGGIAENVGFLSQPNYNAPIRDAAGNFILDSQGQIQYSSMLNSAGVGVTAAVVSLVGSLLNGGINGDAVKSALKAGVIGYTSAAITTALVGTAGVAGAGVASFGATAGLFSTYGAAAGPVGIAVGFALGYLTQGLFAKTQYIHGETVSHITQVQADGSLLLIGTRPAGSLLRTTGTSNDDYYGNDSANDTAGHDVIVGQAGMNEIYARGGHDMMEGRAAADYIEAGTGDDRVEAGEGNDFVNGGAGNDRLFGGNGDDSMLGGTGNDQMLGGNGNDALEGQEGNDQMYGGAGNDQMIGGTGDDTLDGGIGDDVLAGEAGNDELDGGLGNDTVQGGEGNDIVAGGEGNDNLEGNSGNDKLLGGAGVDVLYGGEGDDLLDGGLENDLAFGGLGKDALLGGFGDDDLYGELGQDLLAGGAGNDLLNGGDDNDVYLFRRNDGADVIDDTSGSNTLKLLDLNAADLTAITRVGDDLVLAFGAIDSVTVKGHFVTPGLARVEFANRQAIDVAALTFNTSGVGSYTSLLNNQNVLASFAWVYSQYQQASVLFNASTYLTTAWITDNYDTRVTTDAVERELYNDIQVRSWSKGGNLFRAKKVFFYDYYETTLRASGYADRVVGMFGAETIDGGAGNDQLYGNVGADTILGGIDHDIIDGGADNDTISGQTGNDKIFGGTGDDTLNGNEGNDTLFGEEGNDNLNGGSEDDYLSGGEGDDRLRGDAGKDLLYGEQGNDNIDGGEGDDYLSGGAGNDTLFGSNGNDLIFGEEGNDTINGGAGDDIIVGGSGTNWVNGEVGTDTIYFSGDFNQYTISINEVGTTSIVDKRPDAPDGTHHATNVERLQFTDRLITLTDLFPQINPIVLPRAAVVSGKVNLPAGYTISLVSAPAQGSVVLNANGSYTYTAPSSFRGATSFRYRVTSPLGITNTMDARITVADPTASGGAFNLGTEQAVANIILRNDMWDVYNRWESPTVQKLTNDRVILTWTNNFKTYYQVFGADGASLIPATPVTTENSRGGVAFGLANGGFVITWLSGVGYWQRFDSNGVPQTAAIRTLPQPTSGGYWDNSTFALTELSNGNIAIVWSGRMGPSDYDIYLSTFTQAGAPVLNPVRVNTTLGGHQGYVQVARLANGNLVVTWRDEAGNDGSGFGAYMRVMSSGGSAVSGQILVSSSTAGDQSLPVVAALQNGDFVVAWMSPQDGSGMGIFAQRFQASGQRLGGQFQVNSFTSSDQQDPAITALNDGGFFVVWQSQGQDGSGYGIYGRRFDAEGNARGGEILINTATNNQQDEPAVTELSNGDLMVTWRSLHSGTWQIMQKRLTASETYMNVLGTNSSETLIGSHTPDQLNGAGGDDILMGNGGADTLTGGVGRDIAQFSGNMSQYTISIQDDVIGVTDLRFGGPDGMDTLKEIEILRFADQDFDWGAGHKKLNDIIMPPNRTFAGQVSLMAGQTASLVQTSGQLSSVSMAADGSFSIASAANFAGTTNFRYQVTAANGVTWTQTVNVTVTTQAAGNGNFTFGTEWVSNPLTIQNNSYDNFYRTEHSELIKLNNGGFVLTWTTLDNDGSARNVYYHVFDASGTGVTVPQRANAMITSSQLGVSGVNLSNGEFALIWLDHQSNSMMWRRFSDSGAPLTSDIRVMPMPYGGGYWDSTGGRLVELVGGKIGVIWSGRLGQSDYDIYLSQFTAAGVEVGYPVRIDNYPGGHQSTPHAATLSDGRIVAVWQDEDVNYDGSGYGIAARLLSADGIPLGTGWRVNLTTLNTQTMPWITALTNGGFVVSWSSQHQDGSGYGVYGQVYDAATNRVGGEIRFNTFTAQDQSSVKLTALSDGGFFAVWQSSAQDGSGLGVYGQRFTSTGARNGSEFRLNETTTNNQELPDIVELNGGDLVATWRSNASGNYQVMRRRLIAPSRYINAVGTQNFEIVVGGNSADTLSGGVGDDILLGLSNNDWLDGGTGTDVARYGGNLANYTLGFTGTSLTVRDNRAGSPDGMDTLHNIEVLSFADQDLDLRTIFPETPGLILPMRGSYTGKLTVPAGYTIAVQAVPGQGSLTLNAEGAFTYQAPNAFSGTTSFQYRLTSAQGYVQIATVNINVLPLASGSGSYTVENDRAVAAISLMNGQWDQYNRRENVTVARLTGGGYVLTWNHVDSDGSSHNIYYQVFDAASNAVSGVTRANTTIAGMQHDATVVALRDGGFALGWNANEQPNLGTTPVFRRYNAQGVAQTAETAVRPVASVGQYWDSSGVMLTELPNGNFAVLWAGRLAETNYQIYLSQYQASGQLLGSPTRVNTTALLGHNDLPQIVTLTNGQIAAVWRNMGGSDGSGAGLYARIINPTTLAMGNQILVNSVTAGEQSLPSVSALVTGGFVVTWASPDASGFGVYGQRFDANGTKVGSQFQINQVTAGDQLDNAVTALADGGFFVTWQSQGQDGSGFGLYGRRFDLNGNSMGAEIQINSQVSGNQDQPAITELTNGDIVVAWRSWHGGTPQIMQKRLLAPTGLGSYNPAGSTRADILVGGAGNDTLTGNDGHDILQGGAGNDVLKGSAGNDTYRFASGDAADVIDNLDSTGFDQLAFGAGIDRHNLWFTQSGYDLVVQVLGSDDKVTLQNWYTGDAQKLDQFTLSSGYKLEKNNVDQLVSAMAGFNPQALGNITSLNALPSSVQNTVVASWI